MVRSTLAFVQMFNFYTEEYFVPLLDRMVLWRIASARVEERQTRFVIIFKKEKIQIEPAQVRCQAFLTPAVSAFVDAVCRVCPFPCPVTWRFCCFASLFQVRPGCEETGASGGVHGQAGAIVLLLRLLWVFSRCIILFLISLFLISLSSLGSAASCVV